MKYKDNHLETEIRNKRSGILDFKRETRSYFPPEIWECMSERNREEFTRQLAVHYIIIGFKDPSYIPVLPTFMRIGKYDPKKNRIYSLAEITPEPYPYTVGSPESSDCSDSESIASSSTPAPTISDIKQPLDLEETDAQAERRRDEAAIKHHKDFYDREVQRLSREERGRLGFSKNLPKFYKWISNM
ncbi:hypothetical protein M8J77_009283 [Diaphorina citri]|nr:hypothetical protein M8J77_009283 [Diaphorina citri]